MPLPALPSTAIRLGARADSWREAVGLAGEALAASGAAIPDYTGRMIDVIDEFGPYAVIAPGLALVHARPGDDVRAEGFAVVTLAEPVPFGHPYNDPVRVVIGLASVTNDEHVTSVAELANVFNDPGAVDRLSACTDPAEVSEMFRRATEGDEGATA